MKLTTVIVGSENPLKLNAVRSGFNRIFPGHRISVQGVDVKSGVSYLPMSEGETLIGAINRVNQAKEAFPDADYWVGIEGGFSSDRALEVCAWVFIDGRKMQGKARTASYFLPSDVVERIKNGLEPEKADPKIFYSEKDEKSDSVNYLTKGVLNRTENYAQGVILALIPFINPEKYQNSGERIIL